MQFGKRTASRCCNSGSGQRRAVDIREAGSRVLLEFGKRPCNSGGGQLRAEDAELVGNYALRIRFSDGHDTGIYTWDYLLHLVEPTAQESS